MGRCRPPGSVAALMVIDATLPRSATEDDDVDVSPSTTLPSKCTVDSRWACSAGSWRSSHGGGIVALGALARRRRVDDGDRVGVDGHARSILHRGCRTSLAVSTRRQQGQQAGDDDPHPIEHGGSPAAVPPRAPATMGTVGPTAALRGGCHDRQKRRRRAGHRPDRRRPRRISLLGSRGSASVERDRRSTDVDPEDAVPVLRPGRPGAGDLQCLRARLLCVRGARHGVRGCARTPPCGHRRRVPALRGGLRRECAPGDVVGAARCRPHRGRLRVAVRAVGAWAIVGR